MATTSDTAMLLLQAGVIIGAFLLAHAYATRHLRRTRSRLSCPRIAWTSGSAPAAGVLRALGAERAAAAGHLTHPAC